MKRVSTQTPSDILRSTSLSSLNALKQKSNSLATTGNVTRPRAESQRAPPGASAIRITEKKGYSISPSSSPENPHRHRSHSPENPHQHRSHSPENPHHHRSHSPEDPHQHRSHSPKSRKSNDKSQMVTYPSIIQATRNQHLTDHPTTIDIIKVCQNLNFIFRHHFFLGPSINSYRFKSSPSINI
jgi:hypothetical protein